MYAILYWVGQRSLFDFLHMENLNKLLGQPVLTRYFTMLYRLLFLKTFRFRSLDQPSLLLGRQEMVADVG